MNTRKTNVILGRELRTLWGRDYLEETLCGHVFRLSVPSFFQINHTQTEVLYRRALELAALTGRETVVDLYCGIGTISLTLAEHAGQVIGVEVVPEAVEDARENARRAGLVHKTRFECGDASDLAARLEAEGVRPDVVVVDPPRKGLAADVVDTIAAMGPERVVYVSCDPATLGRDVGRFAALGYTAVAAEAVDLFPRTAHVETVCLLALRNPVTHINIDVDVEEMVQDKRGLATYGQIKDYVLEQNGLKVSSLYIAQVKQKHGIIERDNYNKPKSEGARGPVDLCSAPTGAGAETVKQPQCPPDKEGAITEALKHFGMI